MSIAAITPKAPLDAPSWAVRLCSEIVDWVQSARRGPQAMTPYTTTNRPSATTYPRSLTYDRTLSVPIYSDEAGNWYALQGSAGPFNGTLGATTPASAVVTTLSITQGAIISGTYLPTLTGVANVAASTTYNCQYMRVGNVVNVSGKLDVDPTALLQTTLGISLPIPSTLSAAEKCSGVGAASGVASEVAAIDGDIINNRAQMDWITTSIANHSMYFDFQYLVT